MLARSAMIVVFVLVQSIRPGIPQGMTAELKPTEQSMVKALKVSQ